MQRALRCSPRRIKVARVVQDASIILKADQEIASDYDRRNMQAAHRTNVHALITNVCIHLSVPIDHEHQHQHANACKAAHNHDVVLHVCVQVPS